MKVTRAVVYGEAVSAYPELCAGAKELADEVIALVIGSAQDAEAVARLGVSVQLLARSDELRLDDYWPVICRLVGELAPQLVLLRSSTRVRSLAGSLAVATGLPVASDPATISVGDVGVAYQLVRYGGGTQQESVAPAVIAVVGPGLFPPAGASEPGSVTVLDVEVAAGPVRRIAQAPRAEESVDLTAADVVVGVGRGIGSPENLEKVAAAARALGAELACSRPIAEGLGWLPKSRYLGVSGAVIRPEVYLALGISGQVQHLVGVTGAKTIVAINKDKAAPIFAQCDLGLVADLEAVLPVLTDRLV